MTIWAAIAAALGIAAQQPGPLPEVNSSDFICDAQRRGNAIATQNALSVARLKQSAANDNLDAQIMMGHYYADGVGVCRNDRTAFLWFQRAAQRNSGAAMYFLASAYADGRGVAKDPTKSFYWARMAAAERIPGAELLVGSDYIRGYGVTKDEAAGAWWTRDAAERGLAPAALYMGLLYANGIGVPRDLDSAHKWIERAGRQGQDIEDFTEKLKLSPERKDSPMPCWDGLTDNFETCEGR